MFLIAKQSDTARGARDGKRQHAAMPPGWVGAEPPPESSPQAGPHPMGLGRNT